jgi:anhydro-N-acetylmuramic acid kinase
MLTQNKYTALGVMSGTSLDGLDLLIVSFTKNGDSWEYEMHNAKTVPYSEVTKKLLREAYTCSGRRLREIDVDFGKFIGSQAKLFINLSGLSVDFIASHGHTVFHEPDLGYTLQIGSGADIAAHSGYKTICDFRSLDLALGGQGAPLVPIGDEMLFGDYMACLNIGGFANVSFRNSDGARMAYDICASNIILNKLCQKLNLDFDEDGKIAASGKRIEKLAVELNEVDFYQQSFPKSLGLEWAESTIMPILANYVQEPVKDLLFTYSEHIAFQISMALNDVGSGTVLITGGGAHNSFLIEKIRQNALYKTKLPEDVLIDYKEALIFAFLGVLRGRNDINCLASVTGAEKDSSGGSMYII